MSWETVRQFRDLADEHEARHAELSADVQEAVWTTPATVKVLRGLAARLADGHATEAGIVDALNAWTAALNRYADAIRHHVCQEQIDVTLMRLVRVADDAGLDAKQVMGCRP